MKLYEKLEKTVDWNKSIEEQLDSLAQYDNISDEEILELARDCCKWFEAGILIEYLGFEKLNNHLPKFLEFLQDVNWAAFGGASNMLRKSGRVIVPEIRRVFDEVHNDGIWHYWILTGLVRDWDKEIIKELKPDLEELIKRADKEGASIQALSILKDENLLSEEEVESYYSYLLNKFKGDDYWINDLNEEIKSVAK